MKYYSWKDIERLCQKHQNQWKELFYAIEVFPDEFIVYLKENIEENEAIEFLKTLFPKNIEMEKQCIKLDGTMDKIEISFDREYEALPQKNVPTFRKILYKESAYPETDPEALLCPVIAFHSYKGGVGRTLSLLAFAKAWTNANKDKLLIIDSDLEAPGLTWIQGNHNDEDFSYLDLLTLIQDSNDMETVINTALKEIGNLTISIETKQEKINHVFIPTFRYDEQLLDIYASPNTIVNTKGKQYILAKVFSEIAVKLGASAVLVDLRAGISEYSAPLLFDPRVKKYFVTSTSSQSIIGTQKLLQYISKGLRIDENSNLPSILLTMVTMSLEKNEKEKIYSSLLESFKTLDGDESLLDNIITELPFASELVHLTDFEQIFNSLKNRDMYFAIENLVKQYYGKSNKNECSYTEEDRNGILEKIHFYADKQITAEAKGALQLLLTQPIKNLCLKFKTDVPNVVIRGTKGSGKTFLYRKLLEDKEWNLFSEKILGKQKENFEETYFLPLFAPRNISQLTKILRRCIEMFNQKISFANVKNDIYISNSDELEKQSEVETDWVQFWEHLFVNSINSNFKTLDEMNTQLKKEHKKIVFLMDGLEEILRSVSEKPNQQKAIQILCQDIVNRLAAKYENVGIIIFLRSDMVQNAITINYEQFKQSYAYAELKWNSDEALKLAVWLVGQSVENFYEGTRPIDSASKEIIDKHLEKLWGLKLGKSNSNEAYSSRWILAALSDFNGQLQARDIIRFLKYAAVPTDKKTVYHDRILMPTEIRHAVSICSEEKIKEIRMEYTSLNPIFEKLEGLPSEKKVLPLNLGEDVLTASEEKLMIQEGYLARDGEKLYLPEIVRHALKFKYEKGARPKVLSLLLKH